MTPAVVIVGAPGAGKTAVGEKVAEQRGLAFRDTDHDVEAVAGRSVSDIFVEEGEPAFRALVEHDGVLALGGGAVLDPAARTLLRDQPVVFLDVGLADAAERVGFARSRPLLVVNPRGELKRMLDERRPLYLEVADVTVPTDGRPVDDVVADVIAFMDRT